MQFSQIDTPSGHVICGFLLMIIGAVFYKFQVPKAEDAIVAGLTVIGFAMKGLNGKSVIPTPAGSDTKTTTQVTSTSVTPAA